VSNIIGSLLAYCIAGRQFSQAHFTGKHGALIVASAVEYLRPGRGKIVTVFIHTSLQFSRPEIRCGLAPLESAAPTQFPAQTVIF
jgi:hypothetical protein